MEEQKAFEEVIYNIQRELENLRKEIDNIKSEKVRDIEGIKNMISEIQREIKRLDITTKPIQKEAEVEMIVKGFASLTPEEINQVLSKNKELKDKILEKFGEIEL